ncbi:RNA polymerase sigma factor, partial [Streptomyces silaceus]|uniref:RNA polymerase sigma factor n=1 Tax=Streptomyces silaceus TaxID=545123 RepID=UPI0024467D51
MQVEDIEGVKGIESVEGVEGVESTEGAEGVADIEGVEGIDGLGDAELCARVRAGDARAFRVLWERHVPMARQFALRWTHGQGGPADAEDAVSEAMLGLLQALRGGRGPVGNVAGYLRVSVRRAAARIASRCRRELLVADVPDRPGGDDCRAGAYFDA